MDYLDLPSKVDTYKRRRNPWPFFARIVESVTNSLFAVALHYHLIFINYAIFLRLGG